MTVKGGNRIKAALEKAQSATGVEAVQVGIFKQSKYPDGTFVATVALVNEFGSNSGKIPERPFMRQAIRSVRDEVSDLIAGAIDTQAGVVDEVLAARIGAVVQSEIRKKIVDLQSPANAPTTLEQKNPKSNPLVDTKTMIKAVDYKVID